MSGGKAPRRKGFGLERELVKQARESGLFAKRAYGSNGAALGLHPSVDVVIGEGNQWRAQAKRPANLPKCMQIPEGCNLRISRGDGGRAVVVLDWFDFLDLLKQRASEPQP